MRIDNRFSARLVVPILVASVTLLGAFASADKQGAKAVKAAAIVGRVVDLEIDGDTTLVTVLAGTDKGLAKDWHARFLEGETKRPLAGGEATLIRADKRTTILKTTLTPEQVRANRFVSFAP